jgi:hypothetical protein
MMNEGGAKTQRAPTSWKPSLNCDDTLGVWLLIVNGERYFHTFRKTLDSLALFLLSLRLCVSAV